MHRTGLSEASISRATLWLSSKGYLQIKEKDASFLQLDIDGKKFLEDGFPERRLINELLKVGGKSTIEEIKTLSQLDEETFNIAIGWARRKRWLRIQKENDKSILLTAVEPQTGSDENLLTLLGGGPQLLNHLPQNLLMTLQNLKKRPKVILYNKHVERRFMVTTEGLQIVQEAFEEPVSQLTSALIKSGKWQQVTLRKYNIQAPVQKIWPGKKQAYRRFLDALKWKLVALGFKEMEGPIVEFMFFNCDALFMPQDHPAREIHDIYYIKHPSHGDLSSSADLIENVRAVHENGWKTGSEGWNYDFALNETQRLVLRSQGTALSARMLVNDELK
ncbi:MAG: tRNA ligase subunit PheS family protein, partial [Candidatus Ranarchaeia archaeon]